MIASWLTYENTVTQKLKTSIFALKTYNITSSIFAKRIMKLSLDTVGYIVQNEVKNYLDTHLINSHN